ncbi:hypothetical protein, partial [Bacteroides heparinolyticus]
TVKGMIRFFKTLIMRKPEKHGSVLCVTKKRKQALWIRDWGNCFLHQFFDSAKISSLRSIPKVRGNFWN